MRSRGRLRKKSFCCWLRPASIGYSTQRLSGLLSLKLRLILWSTHTFVWVFVCVCVVCVLFVAVCRFDKTFACHVVIMDASLSLFLLLSLCPFPYSYVCPRPSQLEPWHCLSTTLVASCAPPFPLSPLQGMYGMYTYSKHIHRHYM